MTNALLKCFILTLSGLMHTILFAQPILSHLKRIAPLELHITNDQTSIIIFPTAVKSVDRGSKDILTKTIKEINNVLKIKASNDSMAPTNLHVFTADGQVYAFNLLYHHNPPVMTLMISADSVNQEAKPPVQFTPDQLNDAEILNYSHLISAHHMHFKGPRSKRKGGARLKMIGAYFEGGVLFFKMSIQNSSAIPYRIDFNKTYIRDKTKSRRSSITEKEILPLNTYLATDTTMVMAFEQFTIADNKQLVFEVFEKNGDRSLTCRIKGKDILHARKLLQLSRK